MLWVDFYSQPYWACCCFSFAGAVVRPTLPRTSTHLAGIVTSQLQGVKGHLNSTLALSNPSLHHYPQLVRDLILWLLIPWSSLKTFIVALDHFNSSKCSGTPQSSITVSQPPTQQTRTEHRDHLPTFEDNTSHDDSISDLLFRLNRAVANLSPLGTADESSTIEPPRYEHIT